VPGVREHVFNVTRRWLDPNGDGDPSDGVDGFRLDVADVVPLGFWRDYRRVVRGINPDAYLVGEVWWEHWPDKLWDAVPWLRGDVFDAIMNYRWYAPTRSFFDAAPPALSASRYAAVLDSLAAGIDAAHLAALMNLTASHDTPRFSTSIYNRDQYKYKNTPRENRAYRIDRPDDRTRAIQQQILVQQFTYIGAPHIWNGDEVGMWGADDPDERKPMVWSDLRYEDEVASPVGRPRPRNRVVPDTTLLRVYRDLIALRKDHQRLFADGALHWLVTDDRRGVLVYDRVLGLQRAVVAFNVSDAVQEVTVPGDGMYRMVYPTGGEGMVGEGPLKAKLAGRSSIVWLRE
jgi:glycosidase